jgi:hypothetical protein
VVGLGWQAASVYGTDASNPQPICNNKTCGDTPDGACHCLCQTHVKTDPDLTKLISAWPALPDALKAGIVAMVKAAKA